MSVEAPAFPIAWTRPGDEHLFWQREALHFPDVVTPLDADLVAMTARGFGHAFRTYEVPMAAVRSEPFNGWIYNAMVPVVAPPEELAALEARAQERLLPVVASIGEHWRERVLPEVREQIAAIEEPEAALMAPAELAAHMAQALERLRRLWELHFETVLPAYMAVSEFEELYRELLEPSDPFEVHRLLQGIPNLTVETGHELWRLARRAVASPVVADVLAHAAAADVRRTLAVTTEGQEFLADLDVYLYRYGHRGQAFGLSTPSWIEDPTPAIKNVKDFAAAPESASPVLESERRAAERERAVAEARSRLAGYPTPVVEQFEAMLRAAQEGLAVSEDHNFWIDFHGVDAVRQVALEVGRRLAAAGSLDDAGDAVMLHGEELVAAAADPSADRRGVVAERRAEMERWAQLTPPPVLGTIPEVAPPDNPLTRMAMKFGAPPPMASEHPDELLGAAGSAGTVRGIARVIRSLADADRLAAGEILVAETTAAPWTPLFATAAAVVTDTGGILSHSAVVAREYGIPAVIGVAGATATIRDGQEIEVDGGAGVVRLIA